MNRLGDRRFRRHIMQAAVALTIMASFGCTAGEDRARNDADTTTTSALRGTVLLNGSTTVFPISEAIAEEFGNEHPNVLVTVGISNSAGGLRLLCADRIDIADASRRIDPTEAVECRNNDIEYIELLVGRDGISVMVNEENTWTTCLTVDELKRIWAPSSKISKWSQVRPEWPDLPLKLYAPPPGTATHELFTERIVGTRGASRSDYFANQDKTALANGIRSNKGSLGFFAFPYYTIERKSLKLVGVDSGAGCVKPSPSTISSGEYFPLSRPLYIYVNEESLEKKKEVRRFVEFYLENAEAIVPEVGSVPAEKSAYLRGLKEIGAR